MIYYFLFEIKNYEFIPMKICYLSLLIIKRTQCFDGFKDIFSAQRVITCHKIYQKKTL